MKFTVSVFTVNYPEYKTILFLAVTMHLCDPHIAFQTLVFLSHHSNLQRNGTHDKKKTLYIKFSVLSRGKLFSTKPLWSPPASSEPFPTRGTAALTTPRRGCQHQAAMVRMGWEDGGFQPFRTALPAPSCTTQADF